MASSILYDMTVPTYCYYEKVCRTMHTTIVFYLFLIYVDSKSTVTENSFNLPEWLRKKRNCKPLLK